MLLFRVEIIVVACCVEVLGLAKKEEEEEDRRKSGVGPIQVCHSGKLGATIKATIRPKFIR